HGPVPPQASCEAIGVPLTGLHVPAEPASLHDSHWPSQDVSQHTPSTQCPLEHSASTLQVTGSGPCMSAGVSIEPASTFPPPLPPEPDPPLPPLAAASTDPVTHFPRAWSGPFEQWDGLGQKESSRHILGALSELKHPA